MIRARVSLFAFGFASALHAGPGKNTLEILTLGSAPRQSAMADASVGLGDDAGAAEVNPGALGVTRRREATLSHEKRFAGMTHQSAGYLHPFRRGGALNARLTVFSYGEFTGYDAADARLSSFDARDTVFSLGYGRSVSRSLSLGAQLKQAESVIGDMKGRALAVDAGALYRPWRRGFASRLGFGAALRNVGPDARFGDHDAPLPRALVLGAAYRAPNGAHLLAVDVQKSDDGVLETRLGGELWLQNVAAVRAGYRTGRSGAGLSFGVGARAGALQVDYSFTAGGDDLADSHRAGVSWRFGGAGDSFHQDGLRLAQKNRHAEAVMKFKLALDADPENLDAMRALQESAKHLSLEGGK